jgi:hypothetical protein
MYRFFKKAEFPIDLVYVLFQRKNPPKVAAPSDQELITNSNVI